MQKHTLLQEVVRLMLFNMYIGLLRLNYSMSIYIYIKYIYIKIANKKHLHIEADSF